MRKSLRWVGLLAVIAAVFFVSPPVFAQSPEQVKSATVSAVEKLGLQTELPRDKPPINKQDQDNIFSWIKPLGQTWVYAILGTLAVLLLIAFREQIMTLISGRSSFDPDATKNAEGLTLEAGARAGAAADDLASQGRYMEAMHLLLLRALTEMRQRIGEQFADSFTSREILRFARLNDSGRGSLRDIISRVEWCYFGEHPVAAADYTACRESFDRFVVALDRERNA
jgi:hypothetical protein